MVLFWRRWEDLNLRGPYEPYQFSKLTPSTTWVHLHIFYKKMAERVGFEPTVGYKPTPIFKTGAINQLDHLSTCVTQWQCIYYHKSIYIVNIITPNFYNFLFMASFNASDSSIDNAYFEFPFTIGFA